MGKVPPSLPQWLRKYSRWRYPADGQSIVENKKTFTWFDKRLAWSFKVMNSFPHLDVPQNLILGPIKAQGRDKKEVTEEALKLLERVGLLDKQHSFARQLSGGQKQRVYNCPCPASCIQKLSSLTK